MASTRLTRTHWVLGAFRRLAGGGPAALRIEPLARDLGATKGSFYHHFTGPDALRDAMLDYWEAEAVIAIIEALAPLPPGAARLRGLADMVDLALNPRHGGAGAEPALRDWARTDASVAAAVARVDGARIAYVAECLGDAGLPPHPSARLICAADIGLGLLTPPGDGGIGRHVHHLLDLLGLPR